MTIKVKSHIESDDAQLAVGIILNDQLLFSKFFQKGDISKEPTVPQKLMFLDVSQRILFATSRFVLKTVGLIGRMLRDISTHMRPKHQDQMDEILFTTPTEGQLDPVISKLYSIAYNNPAFKALIMNSRSGDKPELVTRTQLTIYGRLSGTTGTDVNMVGIHPKKIYGDEQAFESWVPHRSRLAALHPGGQVVYAGVPNDVRTSPFYALDVTKAGSGYSKHKMSVLDANPLFLGEKAARHRAQLIKDFGGRTSPQYITQILGQWGDEAASSFPPGSIAWFREGHPYFAIRLSGQDIKLALRQGNLPMTLKIPQVRPVRAVIGWDYGYSPDPTTFLIAIQVANDPIWYTYARVSLYQTAIDLQIDVLKYLVQVTIDNRLAMLSTDSQPAYQLMMSDENKHIFDNRIKLTNAGGTVEMDIETGEFIHEDIRDRPDIQQKRQQKKLVYQVRKYYLTEISRRMMQATIMGYEEQPRLMLGYDSEFENELVGTIERKTPAGRIVYEVPRKGRTEGRVTPDQIVDGMRAMSDCIAEVDRYGYKREADPAAMLAEMGWVGRRLPIGAKMPWD